jgi:hypothetical protein
MALPKFEDWTPPWGSDDSAFDVEKAKKRIYDLLSDKETSKAKHEAAIAELAEKHKAAQAKVDEFETANLSEVEKLRRELEQAKATPAQGDNLELARLRIALNKGLTESQVKRLIGSTEEELLADADAYMQEHGLAKSETGEQEQGSGPPARRPVGELRTGMDLDAPESFNPADLAGLLPPRR